jgi:hypothetical protein
MHCRNFETNQNLISLNGLIMAAFARLQKCAPPHVVGGIDSSPGHQEQFDCYGVAFASGKHEAGSPIIVTAVYVASLLKHLQKAHAQQVC